MVNQSIFLDFGSWDQAQELNFERVTLNSSYGQHFIRITKCSVQFNSFHINIDVTR